MMSQNGYRHTSREPTRIRFRLLGTAKCLVALAEPFLVLYYCIFALFSWV